MVEDVCQRGYDEMWTRRVHNSVMNIHTFKSISGNINNNLERWAL